MTTTNVLLSTLTPDPPCQLNVFRHDGHTLGMDSTQVGVFKETHKICLSSLLKCQHSVALETQVSLEVLRNFTNKPLEWELPDQELSTLLILADLTKSNSSRAVSVWLLDTSSGWGRLTSSLSSELLPRSLPSGGFTSSLLGTSHLSSRSAKLFTSLSLSLSLSRK